MAAAQPDGSSASSPRLAFWRYALDEDVALNPECLSAKAKVLQPALLTQKGAVTGRISETTRTLAFGSLGSCYALLLADKDLAAIFAPATAILSSSAGFAIAAIITDALQYVFAYGNVQQALSGPEQTYPKNWLRRGRSICFVLKQVFAYTAAALLLIAIASTLL